MPNSCAIAQALRPAFNDSIVSGTYITLDIYDPRNTTTEHTHQVQSFIRSFDSGFPVEPIELIVDIPESHVGCVIKANQANLELILPDEASA